MNDMDTIFVALYAALSVMLGFLLAEAVSLVRRAPAWSGRVQAHSMAIRADRRSLTLPFVGAERRHGDTAPGLPAVESDVRRLVA